MRLIWMSLSIGLLSGGLFAQVKTELWAAARAGDLDRVTAILPTAKVDLKESMGRSLVHEVALSGNVQLLDLVVAKGAHLDRADDFGWTPLMVAATRNDVAMIEALIAHGAAVDQVTDSGKTPLMYAVGRNHLEAAQALLEKGAKVDAVDGEGLGVADHLRTQHDAELAKLVGKQEEKGFYVRIPDPTKEEKSLDRAQRPMQEGRYYEGLLAALWRNDAAAWGTMIQNKEGLDLVGPYGETPLHVAVERKLGKAVNALIKAGAAKDKADLGGWTPFLLAISTGQGEVAQQLLNAGANVNAVRSDGLDALMMAAHMGDGKLVKRLLRAKINRKAKDPDGRMAIDYVNRTGDKELYKIMRQLGLRHGSRKIVTMDPELNHTRDIKAGEASKKSALTVVAAGDGFYLVDKGEAKRLQEAYQAYRQRDDAKAQAMLDEAMKTDTPHVAWRYLAGLLAALNEDLEGATEHLEHVRKHVPNQYLVARLSLMVGRIHYGRNPIKEDCNRYLLDAWRLGGMPEALIYWARAEGVRDRHAFGLPLLANYIDAVGQEHDDYAPMRQLHQIWKRRLAIQNGTPLGELGIAHVDNPNQTLNLEEYRGKVVLLFFWASWAHISAAVDEFADPFPVLHRLYKWHPKRPFEMISISGDANTDHLHKYVAEHEMTWPTYRDVDLKVTKPLLGIKGYPTILLLDHQGKVIMNLDAFSVNFTDNLRTRIKEEMTRAERAVN